MGWPTLTDMQRAAEGDTTAFSTMMIHAADAAERGAISPLDGLVAADLWGCLAAAFGQPKPLHMLAEVLLRRTEYERQHGTPDRALWHASEAVRRLGQAADAGEEAAGARLAGLVDAIDPEALVEAGEGLAEKEGHDRIFRAAATGDVDALSAILDQALLSASVPGVVPLETVTIVENVARLGAATNDPRLTARLVGGMFMRGQVDRETDPERAERREVEALGVIASMIERGMPQGREIFHAAETALARRTLILAAWMNPSVLGALTCEGSC